MPTTYIAEPRTVRYGRYTGPASYVTGGEAITAATFGLSRLDRLMFSSASSTGLVFTWDEANAKVKAFWTGAGLSAVLAEVTATTNLSTAMVDVTAVGLP